MVALFGAYHNDDLQAGNPKPYPQLKLQSTFNAISLAE
jgi:hypothetical protein